MKRFFAGVILAIAGFALIGCASSSPAAETDAVNTVQSDVEHTLVILHTNDHHGHPVAFYDYPADGQGGLPARLTYVNGVRAANENVLVLDAGDVNTGRPESNFFMAEPDIIGYNAVGYDAMAMGNHEFDPAPEDMQKQIAQSDFPWLCANVKKADGSYIDNVEPYIIKDYGSFKVAVLGLMTTETEKTGNPANISGLVFEDEVETANELVPELKKRADIVVALVHMGIYPEETKGSKKLAVGVPGLALIIDGHTHTKTEEPIMVNNVPIVSARQWGLYMGQTTLSFMNGEVTNLDFELVPINVKISEKLDDGSTIYKNVGPEFVDDAALLSQLTPFVDKVDVVLSEVIGTATGTFLNSDTRSKETAIGDLVADSMQWYANEMNLESDFAFQNGGGVRTDLPEGEIRKEKIYEILPFDNSVYVVTMKGSDIIALFESTPANVTHGAMPQVSREVSFTIDTASGTISDLLINGAPVDPAAEYKVVTNSYLAAGGDGYAVFTSAIDGYDTSLMQRDALIEYIIGKGGTVSPEVDGRMIVK